MKYFLFAFLSCFSGQVLSDNWWRTEHVLNNFIKYPISVYLEVESVSEDSRTHKHVTYRVTARPIEVYKGYFDDSLCYEVVFESPTSYEIKPGLRLLRFFYEKKDNQECYSGDVGSGGPTDKKYLDVYRSIRSTYETK